MRECSAVCTLARFSALLSQTGAETVSPIA
jgi:hypothetical protein